MHSPIHWNYLTYTCKSHKGSLHSPLRILAHSTFKNHTKMTHVQCKTSKLNLFATIVRVRFSAVICEVDKKKGKFLLLKNTNRMYMLWFKFSLMQNFSNWFNFYFLLLCIHYHNDWNNGKYN